MSVIVMGMEMPQRCMGCTLCYVGHMGDLMCEALRRPIKVDETGRDRFCPLIEVPTPHGRLGDLDELIEKYGEWYTEEGTESGYIGGMKSLLEGAPTVIGAECET